MSGSHGKSRASAHVELRVYDVFVIVEGLRVRVPKPLLGFIPFGVSKRFGFYSVIRLAAPESCETALLLDLVRAELAEEFAPISRNPPHEWRIQQINCRQTGAAVPISQQPGCVDRGWGALWYALKDEAAKRDRYELAKTRLWEQDFKAPGGASVPIPVKHVIEVS